MDTGSILIVARWEGSVGGIGEEVRGLRNINWQLQNSHWDIKYGIGNGAAKEPMTHGHEQWWEDCLRERGMLGGRGQRENNWANCSSIINKI